LVVWSILTAKACEFIDTIVVTSDDLEVMRLAMEEGVEAHYRPEYLAHDDTPMLPVITDVFAHYPVTDCVVLLQPTSPFREVHDIESAYRLLKDTNADSVFSTSAAPDDLVFQVGHAKRLRQLPDIVVPNGSLFLITVGALQAGLSWFDGEAYGYSMPKDRSIDIDTPLDFEIAKMIAAREVV
jgi:CMP-N-acetylneuraminic acid synthetase